MHVISFKNTALFKQGIWLSAAALITSALAPFLLDGSLWRNPAPGLAGACAFGVFFGYFLRKLPFHRLADEVVDCGEGITVRRGSSLEVIPFSNIVSAEVTSSVGLHRITVRLREPSKLGRQIEFLPQASLWSNLPGVRRVAAGLADRASGRASPRDAL